MSMRGSTIGTLAGAIIGAVAGSFIPGVGTLLGASIGATLGGTIGGIVDYVTAGDQVNRQESIAGLQVQTSSFGQPMAQIFDSFRVAGNIIFLSPKKVHEHRQTEGGKGGPSRVTITKTYSVDIAIALADTLVTGPLSGITKAWADGTLIYDQAQRATFPVGWTFYPGTDTQPVDPTMVFWYLAVNTPRYIYTSYLVMDDYDMGQYPRVPNFTFEVTQGERLLPDVVRTLVQAAGVPEPDLVVSDLPESRVRLLLTQVQSVRAVLEQLMVAFRFYLRESGITIEARTLGSGDIVADIPEGDLDATEREAEIQGLQVARERSRRLPTQLHVSYTAPSRSYQQSTQLATLGTLESVESPRSVATSVALEDADAKALAQENLDRVWIERTQYALAVGRRWACLEPGDRIRVTSREQTHTILLTEVQYGRPGLVQLKGKGDSVPVMYVPGAPPAMGDFPDTILEVLQQTLITFLELPAMDDNDQAPRVHVIYSYPEEDWPGATLHRSVDGGASYALVSVGTLEAIAGTALTVLPDAPAHFTDTVSTVQVHLDHGQIVSLTPAAFQAGGNLAMLGSELIQFRDAQLIGAGTYELRHLWRGRRGTAWATGTHVTGERFTWIDRSVYRVEQTLGDRFVARQWKAVTNGLDISLAAPQTYAIQSENLRPWSVASLRLELSGSDWVISWRGRARFTGTWVDGSQTTPDPDWLAYRVVIYTDATQTTIVRQVDVGDSGDYQMRQVYTYDSSQQTADFGSVQSVLYAQVFQVGRTDVSRAAAA